MNTRAARIGLAAALVVILVAGIVVITRTMDSVSRKHVTGYFANSNGLFVGDEVRILGVPVGKIDKIEPQVQRVKIDFWVDDKYQVPANANAVVLAPALVTARAIQLTPVYAGGPELQDGSVIPEERTAVPVEWDDVRVQLQRLTDTLQPDQPGGVSSLGSLINTAADNLRGEGTNIRDTLIKLSQAFSALGDHSTDLFGTFKNLSALVSALQDSTDLMRELNQNLGAVTGLLANSPNEVGSAADNLNAVIGDVKDFVAENRETLGTTSDKLASITTALNQSLDDLKQTLHISPTLFQNFVNIYQPAQGALTGALALNNFANPITFICGAIQAASRLGAEQSAKLCAQYLAPVIKNRQYNFLPLGQNLFVGATARPNEVTYSEDWMRPDYIPPPGVTPPPPPAPTPPPGAAPPAPAPSGTPLAAEAPTDPQAAEPHATNPADGLQGIMVPTGGGS
jgi:phospholipid/cholesterol/gamma-HCH transport system substrate-binding protein